MRRTINHMKAGFRALVLAAIAGQIAPAHAQTISNVATLQWQAGSSTVAQRSNQVDIAVDRPDPSKPTLTTWQFSSDPGAQNFPVPQTLCQGSAGMLPIALEGAFAGVSLAPASVSSTTRIRAGEPLVISISAPADDRDPAAIDTLTVTISTPAGDAETLTLRESGANTGQFVGLVPTSAIPPDAVRGDCQLSLRPGDTLTLSTARENGALIATAPVEVLIDPYGIVFDSGDGSPVTGSKITLIDADSGAPAIVFGDDAVSHFPSSIVTGSTVSDSSGATYKFPAGEYRFPFVKPGRYRLLVEPPSPYTAPSASTAAQLTALRRPDGAAFVIGSASYGAVFTLSDPEPVRIDTPVDKPGSALGINKTASTQLAVPGDGVQYRIQVTNSDANRMTGTITVTDHLPTAMRLKPNTVRFNGALIPYSTTGDGRTLTIPVSPLAGRATGTISYLLEILPDAPAGLATNRAQAIDSRGTASPIADVAIRIARDGIGDRLTIIGRITEGCETGPETPGLGGVRVMLEDGSYAVTDIDGRYHFEGIEPGTHVVQIDPSTLGSGLAPMRCGAGPRDAGSAISRFVSGQGGALLRVDFAARHDGSQRQARAVTARPEVATDAVAAGAERDWFAGQSPGIAWLFPESDHNPRTKAIRVAIKHLPGQRIALSVAGKPVDPLAFDGVRKSGDGQIEVSVWRAIDIGDRDTPLVAEIRNVDGSYAARLTRSVHYATSALRAEFMPSKSLLVADGVTRPVIALRMVDRDGRPVHQGMIGDFTVPAPYAPAVEVDAQAARQLAGLERARPVWRSAGDDGIAYVELEPTTASGALSITLPFRDGETTRTQRIDMWLDPGDRPWTVVGLAEGTAGFNTLDRRLEPLGADSARWQADARLALYAKGRIRGKWLLTLAYDSKRREDQANFGGTIDPAAYYTIYADRSERRYDAASVRKLYLRLERPQFYALFGDYATDLSDTQLARYNRSFNGVKAQYRSAQVGATAFAADTPYRHRHEEQQGNGLSGPYGLGARDIMANSEVIAIETRDRLRSDRILDRRTLTRHIDYDIDYAAGTLRFREPILSRSSDLNPQFIVIDYEVDGIGQRVVNAGARVTWNNKAKTLTLGASALHDETDIGRTNLGGVDVRYSPNAQTEIRAELAHSVTLATAGSTPAVSGGATAWLVEAEHHGRLYDLLAYAREQQAGFGVGQLNGGENGTRKVGADGRLRLGSRLSLIGSAWNEAYLETDSRRQAGKATIEYRGASTDLRAGLQYADDQLTDGTSARSTTAQIGATRRMLDNRVEIDGQTEIALDKTESIDFPARHRLGARFAITPDVALVGSYEIARGKTIDADTARIGFDIKPWAGARLTAAANQQTIAEYGPRSFASYGLAQSLPIGKRWTVDFTLDGSQTLAGVDPARVLNLAQPVASGGIIGTDGTIAEDFVAVTAGANYRGTIWSWVGRAEYRAGDRSDKYGITTSALRQLGDGQAVGGTFGWFRAATPAGPRTETTNLAVSWASRPAGSRFALLEKLELRSDIVRNAVAGQAGPIGGAALTITGDATSRRIVNSLSLNWSPNGSGDLRFAGRGELSLFWGSRYVFDRIDADDIAGWSNLVGLDLRRDLSAKVDIGISGTLRASAAGQTMNYAIGPSLGLSPFKGGYASIGYNVVGFRDVDYADARYARSGPYVTLRFKFDQTTFEGLGLRRR